MNHDFDCECSTCNASDIDVKGMARFTRKATPIVAPIITEPKTQVRHLMAGQRVGRGRVRSMSPKQERYIKFLIDTRDTSNLNLIYGQTLDPNEIPFMGLPATRALIDKLLNCPIKPSPDSDRIDNPLNLPGSPKQRDLILSLAKERILAESDIKLLLKQFPTANLIIKALFSMPKPNNSNKIKEELNKAQQRTNEEYIPETVIPGYYRDSENEVWKVQFNKAGTHLYALKRVNKKKYEFISGAIKNITTEMFVSLNPLDITLEEAKEYGRKTGTCYMCSRTLTNPISIAEGIGPICSSKF